MYNCDINYRRQYYILNKDYIKKRVKKYKNDNREHIRDNRREHDKKYLSTEMGRVNSIRNGHKYRTSKIVNGGEYTNIEWSNTLNNFNNSCAYCGDTNSKLTVEHVIPVSMGGNSFIFNLIPSCIECNHRKSATALVEWYPKQRFYTEARMSRILKHIKQ